jgi:hypothetical protein
VNTMSNRILFSASFAIACLATSAASPDELRITGPFTHDNLSIYLLHRSGKRPPANLLTLREAMEQKKAVVYETGNVQELAIENVSSQSVYVQAGDIVKGGRKDRVLTTDLLLPPHSGKLPIASFCVEQGRWTKRGDEPAEQFHATASTVPTRALKMAVREPGNQSNVWRNVAEARTNLVTVSTGQTSMQLALEDRNVAENTNMYLAALSRLIDSSPDAVGYVYAVNGKFSGADVYTSSNLFRRTWPKLLQSSAVEALAERPRSAQPAKPLDAAAIRKALTPTTTVWGAAARRRAGGSQFEDKNP